MHIENTPSSRWVNAGERRMLNWGGRPGTATVSEELPPFLHALVQKLVNAGVYSAQEAPNHCLINQYSFGAGIAPHQDGPLYLDKVATITLAGRALLSLSAIQPDNSPGELIQSVLLTEGCLMVLEGEAYSQYFHSIASRSHDIITDLCCNRVAAGVQVGNLVPRAPVRYSLVFVHKRQW